MQPVGPVKGHEKAVIPCLIGLEIRHIMQFEVDDSMSFTEIEKHAHVIGWRHHSIFPLCEWCLSPIDELLKLGYGFHHADELIDLPTGEKNRELNNNAQMLMLLVK